MSRRSLNISLEFRPEIAYLHSPATYLAAKICRSVAQLVSALAWGARGRPFESARSDHCIMGMNQTEPIASQSEPIHRDAVLVLIPVYNAAQYLPELITRLRQFVCDENLLFVNDGSTDDSLVILEQEHVHFRSYEHNRGKGAALQVGFDHAIRHGYRSVLTIDADLQHLPEELPRFFARDNGHRLLMGTRNIDREVMPFDRWLTNNLTSLIISVFSDQRVRDSQSGYRLVPVSLLRRLPLRTIKYDLESEMLFKAGADGCAIGEVPIATVYEGSHSFINPVKDTLRFIRQIWKRIWA
jgi:hypothetical protein